MAIVGNTRREDGYEWILLAFLWKSSKFQVSASCQDMEESYGSDFFFTLFYEALIDRVGWDWLGVFKCFSAGDVLLTL